MSEIELSFRGCPLCFNQLVSDIEEEVRYAVNFKISLFPGSGTKHSVTCSKQLTRVEELEKLVEKLEREQDSPSDNGSGAFG